ncbi:hypothetical protein SAMN05660464_3680 [Geodermatophilus dictyosporus]|uniref:DUF5671 domain-containing protein n=1 Tax=Geodermatophilus dictyosporus TaxID=1523247 RepID=A0A1I5RRQ4_9ACTN|nr:hypothetical protein [Geodermatophilus dictyosporus]SFP61173.1 hypothetical protein SAMN05660464_3680 [Geodermatophilus dictyosporus]
MAERLTLRNVYLYLVCLVALVISIFATVQLVRGVVSLAYPDPGYGYVGDPVLDDETERELAEQAVESQRRFEVLEVVTAGTTLLIAGPLYAYHWRRVQRERTAAGPEVVPTA